MFKKLLRLVMFLFVINICFFMCYKSVLADMCRYYSPMSFINKNNVASDIQFTNLNDADDDVTKNANSIMKYELTLEIDNSQIIPVKSTLRAILDVSAVKLATPAELGIMPTSSSQCPDYVEIVDGKISQSGSKSYQNFISGGQYKSTGTTSMLVNVEYLDGGNSTLLKAASTTLLNRGIFLINIAKNEKYPRDNYNKFRDMLNIAKDGTLTDEQKKESLKALNVFLDSVDVNDNLIETNATTINSEFYNATKDRWYQYMQNDLKNPKASEGKRKEAFAKWFMQVSTYIFEEDLNKFIEYFDYIYKSGSVNIVNNRKCDRTKEGCGEVSISDETYSLTREIITEIINYKSSETALNNLNKCDAYCNCVSASKKSYNSYKCSNCNNSSLGKLCYKCLNESGNECYSKGNPDDIKKCRETKEKECMGATLYGQVEVAYERVAEELRSQMQDAANNAYTSTLKLSELRRISDPILDVTFNNKYEVKCEDVKMLHSIYMALIIIGPILVVVLGTIDYAKAVIASDEKKMQENKKKFPKRLIAGVLLLLVPFIIKFLLSIFGGNLKLLKCIVNGIIMKF